MVSNVISIATITSPYYATSQDEFHFWSGPTRILCIHNNIITFVFNFYLALIKNNCILRVNKIRQHLFTKRQSTMNSIENTLIGLFITLAVVEGLLHIIYKLKSNKPMNTPSHEDRENNRIITVPSASRKMSVRT